MPTCLHPRSLRLGAACAAAFCLLAAGTRGQSTPAAAAPAAPPTSAASAPPVPTAPAVAAAPATTPAASPANSENSNVVQLNPFEVKADSDNSYGALESNSITRFRTDLTKMPITAQVFTQTFMDDVSATSVEDMIAEYGGGGISSSDPASAAINGAPGDRQGNSVFNIRGLRTTAPHRDGFISMSQNNKGPVGSTDSFSAERVELIEGPQALLYGSGGIGGVINIVSKQARFDTSFATAAFRLDQYGSKRATLDYGYGDNHVAVRVALVDQDQAYRRVNLGGKSSGGYAQLAFRLPHRTILRLWGQSVDNYTNHGARPGNINNFLSSKDPRRSTDIRYLMATGQLAGLDIFDGTLNWNNIDSFESWWASEVVNDKFAGLSLETEWTPWLSSQFAVVYDDTYDDRFDSSFSFTPGGVGTNPFPNDTAVAITPSDTTEPSRSKAARFSLLATNDFFHGHAHSQTILGIEGSKLTSGAVSYKYYEADANGNILTGGPSPKPDYFGRIPITAQWYSIQNGPPKYAIFRPGSPIVNIGGVNYVRQSVMFADPALVSPANPEGLVGIPNGGHYDHSVAHVHAYYAANLTQWFNDEVETVIGLRYDDQQGLNLGPTRATPNATKKTDYMAGVSVRVLSWLRAFTDISTGFNAGSSTSNPYGVPLLLPTAGTPAPDVGLKFFTPGGAFNGSLTYYTNNTMKNDALNIGSTLYNAINPSGINGRYGQVTAPDQWINFDRTSRGLDLMLTAHPTHNWRAIFNATDTDGTINSGTTFKQLYNDQFNVNKAGQVTYTDGTPVMVPNLNSSKKPTGGSSVLTLATLNDPNSVYYAFPDPDSGRITNSLLVGGGGAMVTPSAVHGSVGTGVTGLPISDLQIAWTDPNGHQGVITPIAPGEKTTGYSQYTLSFFNDYTFDHGPLNGLGLGFGVHSALKNRSYYYTPVGGAPVLYSKPALTTFELVVSYQRKLWGKYVWKTQLNVKNLFNHYGVLILPTETTGVFNNAALSAEPRMFIWTNSIEF